VHLPHGKFLSKSRIRRIMGVMRKRAIAVLNHYSLPDISTIGIALLASGALIFYNNMTIVLKEVVPF